MKKLFYAVACGALLGVGAAARADIVFNLTNPTSKTNPYPGSTTLYTNYNYSAGGKTLNVTGWSYNGSGTIIKDAVGLYSGGLGIEVAGVPNHAIDNEGSDFDMLLLSFSAPVSLNALSIGYVSNDSDVSLLALTSGTPTLPFTGHWQDLLGAGWVSAGNYYDAVSHPAVNPGGIVAQYWLVGAINPALGGPNYNANVTTGNDYFKLSGVTVCPPIPEPTSFVLAALGLVSAGMLLRRRSH